jgi:pimeloyl-ACP methyl ester carboxylesterase
MVPLVMIPALGCDGVLYDELAPALADLVAPRAIVAGADRLAACVADVLASAPAEFVILGTSFGGRVAMEVAAAAPDRVSGLIVIGASAGPSPDPAAGHRRTMRLRGGEFAGVLAEMADMVAHPEGPHGAATRAHFIAMAERHGAELMARQSDALAHRGDLRPAMAALACPALLIWGRHDRFVAAADGMALAATMPRARFVEIAQCGHFPSLEAPEETAMAIRHWLIDMGIT